MWNRCLSHLIAISALFLSWINGANGQCTYALAQFPDSICSNEGINPTSIDSGFAEYAWYFGLQTPQINETPENLGNPGNSLSSQTFGINVLQVGNQWHGFVKKSDARSVYRYDFGSSLLNSPNTTALNVNAFANDGSISNDDIDIIQVDGNWYGFTPVRDGAGIVRYDFGTSLDADTVSATNLGNMDGAMNWPRSLKVIEYQDSVYLIVGNYVGNSITIYNLGVDPTNAAPVWSNNFSTNSAPVVNQVISVMPYISCGKWIVLAGGRNSDNLVRYQFDGGFSSAPTSADELGSGANFLDPYEITPLYESGRLEFYVRTRTSSSSMTRLVFNDSIDQPVATVLQQTFGNFSFQLVSYAMDISIDQNGTHIFCVNASNDLRRVFTPHQTSASPHVYNGLSTNGVALDTSGLIPFSLLQRDAVGNMLLQRDSIYSRTGPSAGWSISGACFGDSTEFVGINYEQQISQVDWSWSLGNGATSSDSALNILYADTGAYSVQLSLSANGCVDSLDTTMFIFPQPTASFALDSVCQGADVFIPNQSSSHPNDSILSTIWTREQTDTLLSFDPIFYFPDSGNNVLTLFLQTVHGCTDTASLTVYAKPAPIAAFLVDSTCVTEESQFTNLSGSTSFYTSAWDFGDGNVSSQESPSHVYPDTGNYTVVLITTSSNACTDTATTNIRISPLPQIGFSLDNGPYCQMSEIATVNSSFSIDSIRLTQLIIGSDTFVGNTSSFVPTGSGLLNGTFSITAGTACSVDTSFSILVHQQPVITLSISDSCSQSLASLSTTTVVTDGQSISSLQWNINDSIVNGLDSLTSFLNDDSLHILIQASTENGCVNELRRDIDVIELPSISLLLSEPFCTSSPFSNQSVILVDSNDAILTQTWQIVVGSDTFIGNDPENLVVHSAGSGDLTLHVVTQKGCSNVASSPIDVSLSPTPAFQQSSHCANQGVFFEGNYDGTNYVFNWSIDGDELGAGADFQHIFEAGGIYLLTYRVLDASSGCVADTSDALHIVSRPNVVIQDNPLCFGNLSELTASITSDSADSIANYTWYVDNIMRSLDSVLRFTPEEEDEVYVRLDLMTTAGCFVEEEELIPVLPEPPASFTASSLFGIVPFETKLKASNPALIHDWSLGTTTLDSVPSFTTTIANAGLHTIVHRVEDANGCTSREEKIVRAYAGVTDLAILDVEASSLNDGSYALTARLRNLGDVPIVGFTLSAGFLNGVILNESFADTLEPSAIRIASFTSSLSVQYGDPSFACVSIVSLNSLEDQVPENDRYCTPLKEEDWLQAFPVPVQHSLTLGVHLGEDEKVFVDVIDLRGGTVLSQSMKGERGYQQWQINMSTLGAGTYILSVETPTRSEQRLIQKL